MALVALVLAVCMLAACGNAAASSAASAAASSAASAAAEEAAEPAAEEAAPAAEEAAPAAEAASAAEPAASAEEAAAEESAYAPYEWPLPLTDEDVTFSVSMMLNPQLASYYAGYEDNPAWQEYSELTGVKFEFLNISAMNISEQYNLMFASQDTPDIMHSGLCYYSAGADAAVDEDVFVDLNDYLEENAPNYLYWVDKTDNWSKITTDEGYRPGFIHILDEPSITKSGPVTHGKWLDELGLDTPTTIDELHDMLKAMYETYGAQCEFDSSGAAFSNAWGTNLTIQTFPSVNYPIYQVDGEVVYGPVTDAAKDYLLTMKEWVDEGIMYSDFATRTSNEGALADFCAGTFSYYNGDTDALVNGASYFTDDDYVVALPYAVKEEGDVIPFNGYGSTGSNLTGQGTFSISTSCSDVELAVKVLDWRYSEQGSFLFNYGVEGISFEYNEDGEPEYTDLIVNNPDGLSSSWLTAVYMDEYGYVEHYTKFDYQLTDEQLAARELWSQNVESLYDLPSGLTLTAEESEIFSAKMADVASYTSESILKMLTGDMDIENDYDTFIDTCYEMGLQDCIDCYQAALERYNAR